MNAMPPDSPPPPGKTTVRSAAPTFLVADVAGTARWYAANLGFDITGCVPADEPYVYASLQRGPAELMLLALADYRKPDLRGRRPSVLWDAYIRVDGLHVLSGSMEGKPFIQVPLRHQSYGDWEFEVRDPNGYVLVFGGGY
jgi:hypothetical protein